MNEKIIEMIKEVSEKPAFGGELSGIFNQTAQEVVRGAMASGWERVDLIIKIIEEEFGGILTWASVDETEIVLKRNESRKVIKHYDFYGLED